MGAYAVFSLLDVLLVGFGVLRQMVIGCSNNNYASREMCKKCGQSKEEAAMPAIAISGGNLPTHANYFARVQGLLGLKMNYGIMGNSVLQQSLSTNSNWSFGGTEKYGLQSWALAGSSSGTFSYPGIRNQLPEVPNSWRDGDWICSCGFHNYSSRSQVIFFLYSTLQMISLLFTAFSLFLALVLIYYSTWRF